MFTVFNRYAIANDTSLNPARGANVHVSSQNAAFNHRLSTYGTAVHDETVLEHSAFVEMTGMAENTLLMLTLNC